MSTSTSTFKSITQGSPEWLAWRQAGIGASEVAAIMGESEYDTPRSLWMVRKGLVKPKENNFAMQGGIEQEAKIRALYELETGSDAPPTLCQHPDLPWARCSLDGLVEERNLPVELKLFGAEKHAMVKAGRVPPSYVAQPQYQMFVTGTRAIHFVSLDQATLSDLVILPVMIDLEYQARMIPTVTAFWESLQGDVPPPHCERDPMEVTDELAAEAFKHWKHAKSLPESDAQKIALATARAEIEALTRAMHPKLVCEGVRANLVQRKTGASVTITLIEASA